MMESPDTHDDDECFAFPFPSEGTQQGNADHAPAEPPSPAAAHEARLLRELKERLSRVPDRDKASLAHARRVRPDAADDAHLMRFLRADDLDVNLALARLLRYWEQRHKVFGSDKFALPVTIEGAMGGDVDTLKHGYICLLHVLNEQGQAIMYLNQSAYKDSRPSVEGRTKALWYLLHVAMEDEDVAKKGYVIISNSQEARLHHHDSEWTRVLTFADQIFPIRRRMGHVCQSSTVATSLVASVVRTLISKEQRKMLMLHNGTPENLLESLSTHSLPAHCVPTDLGGTLCVSTEAFIRQRLASEASCKALPISISAEKPDLQDNGTKEEKGVDYNTNSGDLDLFNDFNSAFLNVEDVTTYSATVATAPKGSHVPFPQKMPEVKGKREGLELREDKKRNPDLQDNGTKEEKSADYNVNSGDSDLFNDFDSAFLNAEDVATYSASVATSPKGSRIPLPQKMPEVKGKREGLELREDKKRKKPHLTKKVKKEKDSKLPGCRGDPRMNRASKAKMEDPDISFFDALVIGGFEFPGFNDPGVKKGSLVKDSDGVTFYQRRNQLMRRLRLAKAKNPQMASLSLKGGTR